VENARGAQRGHHANDRRRGKIPRADRSSNAGGVQIYRAVDSRDKIVLGGEESAGLTIRGHIPEKDGILACLLVAEMLAARGAPIGEQVRAMFRNWVANFGLCAKICTCPTNKRQMQ